MGSDQKENKGDLLMADVDTSAPFESVMEAVTRFGGIGFWKPPTRNPSQTNAAELPDSAKVKDQAPESPNDLVKQEKETLDILNEIEETKTKFEELKLKLQKQEFKVRAHQSNGKFTKTNTTTKVQSNDIELSKTEILKRVEEATKEIKDCTRVLEETLNRVIGSRDKSTDFMNSNCKMLLGPTVSIGQILRRKLVLAEANSVKSCVKWKVSLGHILKRGDHGGEKGVASKRIKFGFCA